jgi:hypothetical protein
MENWKQFSDPRVVNLFLLGAGLGHVAAAQAAAAPAPKAAAARPASHQARGEFFVGQDSPVKQYGPMAISGVQALAQRAAAAGMRISGNNPWSIDTKHYGVKFDVSWDPSTQLVTVTVIDKDIYVPYGKIWDQVDALLAPAGAVVTSGTVAHHKLQSLVGRLRQRYGLSGQTIVAQATPPSPVPDYGPLSRGCPTGMWFDPLSGSCRPAVLPKPPPPSPPLPMPQTPFEPVPMMATQGDFYAPAYPLMDGGYAPWPWAFGG